MLRLLCDGVAIRTLVEDVLAELGWRKLEAMQSAGIYAAVLGVACEARLKGIPAELLLRELEDDHIKLLAGVIAAAMRNLSSHLVPGVGLE